VGADLPEALVGGRWRDQRHAAQIRHHRGGRGGRAEERSDERHDARFLDELARRDHATHRISTGVLDHQLVLPLAQAVDLLQGEQGAVVESIAQHGIASRQRAERAHAGGRDRTGGQLGSGQGRPQARLRVELLGRGEPLAGRGGAPQILQHLLGLSRLSGGQQALHAQIAQVRSQLARGMARH
jgi:hypothetical protein